MKRPLAPVVTTGTLLVLGLLCLPTALAHGDDGGGHGAAHGDHVHELGDQPDYPPTYFSHTEFSGLIYAHIALMTIAWVFILPVAVMLSLAASRYTLASQFVFIVGNALGLLLGAIYNAKTPDLYPKNAHHTIGWIITWVVSAHVFVSLIGRATKSWRKAAHYGTNEEHRFLPVSSEALEDYNDSMRRQSSSYSLAGIGSHHVRATSESLHSHSGSTAVDEEEGIPMPSPHKEYGDDEDNHNLEDVPLTNDTPKSALLEKVSALVSSRVWKYINFGYQVVDRIVLPFGFIALATGIVTYGRLFEGHAIFGGLAHWIKGGVFFWLGIFTLGRWAGSFADLGWAWNIRPSKARQAWRPSAEFVESFLIFFYGSTNIFLEHLGDTEGQWSAQDFEHISITVLFLGGGMCGMLVESTRVRDLLNINMTFSEHDGSASETEKEQLQDPPTYEFSLNPIPALVILLLGIMMSSHQQTTMISSMVHKQWGDMLLGASFARGLTYVLVFLKPPKSIYPSRPPTELLAAFGLISGGILFMASSSDTVEGMIHYDMDAMFMYTVTMGLVGLLMAWEIVVLSVKGWALRRERRLNRHRFN